MELASASARRRDHSKLEKARRIKAAARSAFSELGYQRASMREIAKRAGVATGTLFLYAPDKLGLLLWIVNSDLERITETTFAEATAIVQSEFLDQLLYVFEARYRYWGANPELSLRALQELLIVKRAPNGQPQSEVIQHRIHRTNMEERIADLVRVHQERGRIRATVPPESLARLVRGIYNSEIRRWLATQDYDIEAGIAMLRVLLRLAIEGCARPIGGGVVGRSN